MECKGKILIVDDNEDVLLSLNMLLKPWTEAIRVISSPERVPEFVEHFKPDVILLDMNFSKDAVSGEEGYACLKKILEIDPQSVVLFITAFVDTEKTVRAIKAGAVDFIPKPWDRQKMLEAVHSAVDLRRERMAALREKEEARQRYVTDETERPFIGDSAGMKEVKKNILCYAPTDANVLVRGENGTGKDVVAHEIHRLSARSGKPMVCIDLGCIPENLFESELFGYEKGAFTGARTAKAGRIEEADGGTLFLDEIGNLSLGLQQKLLTVIEKHMYSRIGSTTMRKIDVRIVAATNADLERRVQEGTFREDLLFRLDTVIVNLPPLRERGSDIFRLAEHFLELYARKYRMTKPVLTEEEMETMRNHAWPGNVRELQHCMERKVINRNEPVLRGQAVPEEAQAEERRPGAGFPLNLEELERQAIIAALEQSNGQTSQAAELLGITRYALYRKIDKLRIG